jgi:uncharacterized protein YjbJ (UPF0337 family)
MGDGTADNAKGKVKETAGDLTGNRDMKREGKADQAAGNAKDKAQGAKEWVQDRVDDVSDAVKRDK